MIVKTLRITIVLTLQNVLHVHRACVTLHGTFVSRKFVEILKRFPIMAIGVKCSLISIHRRHCGTGYVAIADDDAGPKERG